MPRKLNAKPHWRAGALVADVKLSRAQIADLCEAAGLDPRNGQHRERMREQVSDAIALYHAELATHRDMPRPGHQRVALQTLERRIDDLIDAFNELDDLSRERLTIRRGAIDPAGAVNQLRSWAGTVALAIRDVEGHENRGRAPNTPRRLLLLTLANVFRKIADDGNLAEFISVACRIAGTPLSEREAQEQADQLDPENAP